jgi:hypothetical protein
MSAFRFPAVSGQVAVPEVGGKGRDSVSSETFAWYSELFFDSIHQSIISMKQQWVVVVPLGLSIILLRCPALLPRCLVHRVLLEMRSVRVEQCNNFIGMTRT